MAITPSRTRNQTTLNALSKMLAGFNGEYAFCIKLLESETLQWFEFKRVLRHAETLQSRRKALRITLYQFDRELDVASIRDADSWTKRFGGKRVSEKTLKKRFLEEVVGSFKPTAPFPEGAGRILLLPTPLQELEALKARG